MAKSRKTAMVQPLASKPQDLPLFAEPDLVARLEKTLQIMKNNRSYTVIEYHQSWASVHFEGDAEPKVVTYRK